MNNWGDCFEFCCIHLSCCCVRWTTNKTARRVPRFRGSEVHTSDALHNYSSNTWHLKVRHNNWWYTCLPELQHSKVSPAKRRNFNKKVTRKSQPILFYFDCTLEISKLFTVWIRRSDTQEHHRCIRHQWFPAIIYGSGSGYEKAVCKKAEPYAMFRGMLWCEVWSMMKRRLDKDKETRNCRINFIRSGRGTSLLVTFICRYTFYIMWCMAVADAGFRGSKEWHRARSASRHFSHAPSIAWIDHVDNHRARAY